VREILQSTSEAWGPLEDALGDEGVRVPWAVVQKGVRREGKPEDPDMRIHTGERPWSLLHNLVHEIALETGPLERSMSGNSDEGKIVKGPSRTTDVGRQRAVRRIESQNVRLPDWRINKFQGFTRRKGRVKLRIEEEKAHKKFISGRPAQRDCKALKLMWKPQISLKPSVWPEIWEGGVLRGN
jgi:hypothetical protein